MTKIIVEKFLAVKKTMLTSVKTRTLCVQSHWLILKFLYYYKQKLTQKLI